MAVEPTGAGAGEGEGEGTSPTVVELAPEDGRVRKEELSAGAADSEVPQLGDRCTIHYTARTSDGTVFDSTWERNQPFAFELGKGEAVAALDMCVATMGRREVARVTCHPEYAYGSAGLPGRVGPDETVAFEVELFDWKPTEKPPWELTDTERVMHAVRAKQRGTDAFKGGRYDEASDRYAKAATFLADDDSEDGREMAAACYSNAALCRFKLERYNECVHYASKALDINEEYVKALFRRGQAHLRLGKLDEARRDLVLAARLEPRNKAIRAEYESLRARLDEQRAKERAVYEGMFSQGDGENAAAPPDSGAATPPPSAS